MILHQSCLSLIAVCIGAAFILNTSSLVSAQDNPGGGEPPDLSSPAFTIKARGTLESADILKLSAPVPDGTKIVTLVPHGSHVLRGDLLIQFEDVFSPLVEEQQNALLQAELHLRQSQRDLEILDNFVKERTVAELLERAKITKINLADKKTLFEQQVKLKQQAISLLEQQLPLVEQRQAQDDENVDRTDEDRFRQYRLKRQLAKNRAQLLSLTTNQDIELRELELKMKLAELDYRKYSEGDYVTAKERLESQFQMAMDALKRQEEKFDEIRGRARLAGIVAPHDGYVLHHSSPSGLREGMLVQEGQLLLLMPDLGKLQVRVSLPEAEILQVTSGQGVSVRFTALPKLELSGAVTSIATFPNETSHGSSNEVVKYDVIVSLDDLPAELKYGMTCQVEFLSGTVPKE